MSKAIKVLAAIVLMLSVAGCTVPANQSERDRGGREEGKEVKGQMVVSDGQATSTMQLTVKPGTSVFEAMQGLRQQGDITMEYRESGAGVFIQSLNGTLNNRSKNMYWMMYVNGNLSNKGVSEYIIKNDDKIEWRHMDASGVY